VAMDKDFITRPAFDVPGLFISILHGTKVQNTLRMKELGSMSNKLYGS
jgi:hypothetical protein